MDFDTILGIVIIGGGIFFLTYMVLWSRRTIEMISKNKLRSLRDIYKGLKHVR